MSKLQQLDVFIGTNTKVGRLILPVGTKCEHLLEQAVFKN